MRGTLDRIGGGRELARWWGFFGVPRGCRRFSRFGGPRRRCPGLGHRAGQRRRRVFCPATWSLVFPFSFPFATGVRAWGLFLRRVAFNFEKKKEKRIAPLVCGLLLGVTDEYSFESRRERGKKKRHRELE